MQKFMMRSAQNVRHNSPNKRWNFEKQSAILKIEMFFHKTFPGFRKTKSIFQNPTAGQNLVSGLML